MHGERASSCATVTMAGLAARTETRPRSVCGSGGSEATEATASCPPSRHASEHGGALPETGARDVARGHPSPSPCSALRPGAAQPSKERGRSGAVPSPNGYARNSRRSSRPCESVCTGPARSSGHGGQVVCVGTTGTMGARATWAGSGASGHGYSVTGVASDAGAVSAITGPGSGGIDAPPRGFRTPTVGIRIPRNACASRPEARARCGRAARRDLGGGAG
jgi:hypothetical protein